MKLAGFFPGQGSQSIGMGKEFYENFAVFRHTLEEASEFLKEDLKKTIFNGPESDLTLTQNAQPVILTVSTACYRVAKSEMPFQTDVHLGHSLGEYSALVASGAIPFGPAVTWVRKRGLAMQDAVPVGEGTMSAVLGASDEDVIQWCKEATILARNNVSDANTSAQNTTSPASPSNPRAQNTASPTKSAQSIARNLTVECANFNSPGQVVVSGSVLAVDELEKLIKAKGIRGVLAKRLSVSAPFHCSLMQPAREKMKSLFANLPESERPKQPTIPYIANVTANLTTEAASILPLLEEQIDHPVLWTKSVQNLMAQGVTRAIEFGPGKVLQGLAKRIAKAAPTPQEFEVLPIFDLESLKAAQALIK